MLVYVHLFSKNDRDLGDEDYCESVTNIFVDGLHEVSQRRWALGKVGWLGIFKKLWVPTRGTDL